MTDFSVGLAHRSVREALAAAGWSASYRYDAAPWEARLVEDGYHVHAEAIKVLTTFGGLTVDPVRSASAGFRAGSLVMDPVWAAAGEAPRIHDRERSLGATLCPVGEWSDEYVVLVADDGHVYAETGRAVFDLGSDFGRALICIASNEEAPRRVI